MLLHLLFYPLFPFFNCFLCNTTIKESLHTLTFYHLKKYIFGISKFLPKHLAETVFLATFVAEIHNSITNHIFKL